MREETEKKTRLTLMASPTVCPTKVKNGTPAR